MTYKSSGAALPSHPTQRAAVATATLPPIIQRGDRDVKLATARDVEKFLSQVWDEPARVVPCHVGGRGPQYYARSEGHWIALEQNATGFTVLPDTEDADYGQYQTVKRYIAAMA